MHTIVDASANNMVLCWTSACMPCIVRVTLVHVQAKYLGACTQAQRHLQEQGFPRCMIVDAGMQFAEVIAWASAEREADTIDLNLNMPPCSPGIFTWACDLEDLIHGEPIKSLMLQESLTLHLLIGQLGSMKR